MKPIDIDLVYGADIKDLFKFKDAIDIARICFEAYSRCVNKKI